MINVRLAVSSGQGSQDTRDVGVELFLIGSSEEAHLRIIDPIATPLHCAICRRPDMAVLLDFGSWPGTVINGRFFRNGILQLFDQDTLQLGATTIAVRITAGAHSGGGVGLPTEVQTSGPAEPSIAAAAESEKTLPNSTKFVEVIRSGKLTVIGFRTQGLPSGSVIHQYRTELLRILDGCQTEILGVDLHGRPYVSSTVLGVLASVRPRLVDLQLYRPSANVRGVLETAQLDKYMHIAQTPEWLE
jgi:hypothetical protein